MRVHLAAAVCGSDQRLKLGFRTLFSCIEQYQNQVTRKQPTVARCRPRQHGRLLELLFCDSLVPAIGVLHRQDMPNVSNAEQKHFGRGPLIQPTRVKHLYNGIRWWQPIEANHRRAGTRLKNKCRVTIGHTRSCWMVLKFLGRGRVGVSAGDRPEHTAIS